MEAILVIVIVILIGVVGGLVYKDHHKATVVTNNTASSIKKDSPTSIKPSTVTGYINIKQWGVKLSINDPTVPSPVYNAPITLPDGNEEVVLGSSTWDSLTCQGTRRTLNIKNYNGFGDDLIRGTNKSTVLSDQVISNSNVIKVGNYYYTYQNNTGIGSCILSAADSHIYQLVNQAYTSNWIADKVVAD